MTSLFAGLGAFFLALAAFDVHNDTVNFFYLGLACWALSCVSPDTFVAGRRRMFPARGRRR